MSHKIKFGTDGWRAIISEDFTFANVRTVSHAIAKYLLDHKAGDKPLIIGYDPRFLADEFARTVAAVMAGYNISCLMPERDVPTPVIAFSILDKKAGGAVMLTASHNPPEYCGMKFIPDYAGPAFGEVTAEIEANLGNSDIGKLGDWEKAGKLFDPYKNYLKQLEKLVDFKAIRHSGLSIVYDSMHGSGRGYFDRILKEKGVKVISLHGDRDVLFGGRLPEPSDENLLELKTEVRKGRAALGLANDGDADRFGVVDERGVFYSANQIIPLVLLHLVRNKKMQGVVVRSIATSHAVDRVAEKLGLELFETPVGFKHIADLMLKKKIIIGGEESGGLSILGHIPEKDGLLANLLVLELSAVSRKPLSKIFSAFQNEFGVVVNKRENLHLTEEQKQGLLKKLKNDPPTKLADKKIVHTQTLDGFKFSFDDGSWLLLRPSGTEPIIRVYAEAGGDSRVKVLLQAARQLI